MKKPLPLPAIIGVVVVAVALAGFVIFKGASGPGEFEPPKTSKVIPKYVYDKMTPDMQKKMTDQGYTVGDVKPQGQPNTAPKK